MRRHISIILLCLMLLFAQTASAEYTLPGDLKEIGDEAFRGMPVLTSIAIPEGVQSIGSGAFADCTVLREVCIPESVVSIGEDAFANCAEALLIQCAPGSAAGNYARLHRLDYRAGTICRALIIGQTYNGTSQALQGPANDLRAVRFCLSRMGWNVNAVTNVDAEGILTAVRSAFAGSTADDISLLYYSGHGKEDGSLVGSSGYDTLAPERLRIALDAIPGRKIVIIDACYSGRLISDDDAALYTSGKQPFSLKSRDGRTDPAQQFISAFQAAFGSLRSRGALNADTYFVITAAQAEEESHEGYISSGNAGRIMGYFTHAFCLGLGYDGITMRGAAMLADLNLDGAVSIQEAYAWALERTLEDSPDQHAAVWPMGCRWFAPFRPQT